jgi:Fe-S cluster assembly iron-binding protein IscA
MLTITPHGRRGHQGHRRLAAGAGGRGAQDRHTAGKPGGRSVEVSVAPVPAEEDQVVEECGAQVFLEPNVAEALDDKVLDAAVEGGEVRFAVGEQT